MIYMKTTYDRYSAITVAWFQRANDYPQGNQEVTGIRCHYLKVENVIE